MGDGFGSGRMYKPSAVLVDKRADRTHEAEPTGDEETSELHAVATERRQRSGLQGGSKDDVGQRNDYLKYLKDSRGIDARRVDVSQRLSISVKDDLEQPLPNAQVQVQHDGTTLATLTSFADGRAQFFPRAAGLKGDDPALQEAVAPVAVGCALRLLGRNPLGVELRQEEYAPSNTFEVVRGSLALAVTLLVALLAGLAFVTKQGADRERTRGDQDHGARGHEGSLETAGRSRGRPRLRRLAGADRGGDRGRAIGVGGGLA
jgi:hypothetical protein